MPRHVEPVMNPPATSRCSGAADEVAALLAYFPGPEAGFVTGASLTIDGGFTA